MKKFFLSAFVFIISITLIGCPIAFNTTTVLSTEEEEVLKYIFIVDSNIYYSIDEDDDYVVLPSNPSLESYIFDGWYYDNDVWTQPFDIADIDFQTIDEDVYIYSKWSNASLLQFYTVTINDGFGNIIEQYDVAEGSILAQPVTPSIDDYSFVGWYKDEAKIVAWNFSTDVVVGSTTLYAKWNSVDYINFRKEQKVDQTLELLEVELQDYIIEAKYLVATARNVCLDQVGFITENSVPGTSISYTSGTQIDQTVSATVSTSLSLTVGFDFFAKLEETITVGLSVSASVGISNLQSNSVNYPLPTNDIGAYYGVAIMGDFNVYQIFTKNVSTGEEVSALVVEIIGVPYRKLVRSSTTDFSFLFSEEDYVLEDVNNEVMFSGGDGSEETPFLISDETEFISIFFDLSANYALCNNISFDTYKGTMYGTFSGSLDGQGFSLSNLMINIPEGRKDSNENYGLFSTLTGEVSNIYLSDCSINMKIHDDNHDGEGFINGGLIAGYATSTSRIDNISIENGLVKIYRDKSASGGIVGHSEGIISNSSVINSTVFGNGDVGGIAGRLYTGGRIELCTYTGTNGDEGIIYSVIDMYSNITGRSSGGLVGYATNSTIISSSVFYTNFIMRGSDDVKPAQGYLVGSLNNGTISSCGWENNTRDDQMSNWSQFTVWPFTESTDNYYFPTSHEYAGKLTGENTIN